MATQIEAGDAKRDNLFLVDPNEITIREDSDVRASPVSDGRLAAMVESLRTFGQLQAISCRRLPDKRIEAIGGRTRIRAIRILREEDPNWRVKVQVFTNLSEQDAFLRAFAENDHRNEMSPVDYSYAIGKMSEHFGMTVAEIAKFFGWSESKVRQTATLRGLDKEVQEKVTKGEVGFVEAVKIAKGKPPKSDAPKGPTLGQLKKFAREQEDSPVPNTKVAAEIVGGVFSGAIDLGAFIDFIEEEIDYGNMVAFLRNERSEGER